MEFYNSAFKNKNQSHTQQMYVSSPFDQITGQTRQNQPTSRRHLLQAVHWQLHNEQELKMKKNQKKKKKERKKERKKRKKERKKTFNITVNLLIIVKIF
jgi:hypothetical protein